MRQRGALWRAFGLGLALGWAAHVLLLLLIGA